MIQFRVRFENVKTLIAMRLWLDVSDIDVQEFEFSSMFGMTFINDDEAIAFKLRWGEYLEQWPIPT